MGKRHPVSFEVHLIPCCFTFMEPTGVCYRATHNGVSVTLKLIPQVVHKYNLYNCMLLLVGDVPISQCTPCAPTYDDRAAIRMYKEIKSEMDCNASLYRDALSRPSSSRTPILELTRLEAFANVYSCTVTLWGLGIDPHVPDLIQIGVARHGERSHHMIYLHGVFNVAHLVVTPDKSNMDCTRGIYNVITCVPSYICIDIYLNI